MDLVFRWVVYAFLFSFLLSTPLLVFIVKVKTEEKIELYVDSALQAYRPMILSGNIRYSQRQIRHIFKLQAGESMALLDRNGVRIFDDNRKVPTYQSSCEVNGEICWDIPKFMVTKTTPIYFDENGTELFGYLKSDLKIPTDVAGSIFIMICAVVFGVITFAFGLRFALAKSALQIEDHLARWVDYIKRPGRNMAQSETVPFLELMPLEQAISGLDGRIKDLESRARNSAQIAALRGIAHDIVTPVSQLKKFHAILIHKLRANQGGEERYYELIDASLDRLSSLARQTKVLRLNDNSSPVAIDLSAELKGIVRRYEHDSRCMAKNINILSDGDNTPVIALVDRDHFFRIVENLINNAVDASAPKSAIRVSADIRNDRVEFTVTDSGTGVPEDVAEKIFDLDFSTKAGAGTGLGLTIVKELCAKNNAVVDFNNIPDGQGACFTVLFQRPERNSQHELQNLSS